MQSPPLDEHEETKDELGVIDLRGDKNERRVSSSKMERQHDADQSL